MERISNPKLKGHSKSQSPSKSPPTSRSHSKSPNPRFKFSQTTNKTPSTLPKIVGQTSSKIPIEVPKDHTLTQKLEEISISLEKSIQADILEGSVSSSLQYYCVLTISQSEKLRFKPFKFPLPPHGIKKSILETYSSTSELTSTSPPHTLSLDPASSSTSLPSSYQPLIKSIHISQPKSSSAIIISSTKGATPSTTQSPSTSTSCVTSSVTNIPKMENSPWNNPGEVQMAPPLHPLPKHIEIWLPMFNPDDGLPAEEHLHNFMLAINLNGFIKENCVVRLFPYIFEGSTGSWYFSLPAGFVKNSDMFELKFLVKFGDD